MNKKVLIGVAWPYVNGELHIGHLAGYLLPADICARYNRMVGNDVLMVSGSDCFGTPTTVEADKRGLRPKDIVAEYHTKDYDLFINTLGLSYDLYTKTDHENHIKVTQDFFVKLFDEGYIFIGTTKQYYSPEQNKFLPDRYVVGKCPHCGFLDARSDQCDNCGRLLAQGELINPVSNLTKAPVELKDTQHYFLDWAKLQPKLAPYVDRVSANWKEWIRKETYGWLTTGLLPREITRDLDWGVPIPKERLPKDKLIENIDSKRIYVWFDAVIGYYSASLLWAKENEEPRSRADSTAKDWKPFWYDQDGVDLKHYYFMGKDNLVFHTLFWPGQLMVFDPNLHLPDVVSINMFLNFDGQQFSKSRGHVIKIKNIVEQFGNDAVRFYLTLIMPEVRDSSFNWQDFEEKVNGILVGNLGNFIHRVLSIGRNARSLDSVSIEKDVSDAISKAFEKARTSLENCQFKNYLDAILELSGFGNSFVNKEKLWELKNTNPERFKTVVKELYCVIAGLGLLMAPLLPHASDRLFKMLGCMSPAIWPKAGEEGSVLTNLVRTNQITNLEPLFKKIELKDKAELI